MFQNQEYVVNIRELFCGARKSCDLSRWDEASTILAIVFIGLITLDTVTALWAVSLGGYEKNTLIAPIVTNIPLFILVKAAEAIFFVLLARIMNAYIRGAAVWCYGAANVIALASVINNVLVLMNLL